MDPYVHTLIATGLILGAYFLGKYLESDKIVETVVSQLLDKLERDGYIAVEEDKDGEKELILISQIVVESIKEASKEWKKTS